MCALTLYDVDNYILHNGGLFGIHVKFVSSLYFCIEMFGETCVGASACVIVSNHY